MLQGTPPKALQDPTLSSGGPIQRRCPRHPWKEAPPGAGSIEGVERGSRVTHEIAHANAGQEAAPMPTVRATINSASGPEEIRRHRQRERMATVLPKKREIIAIGAG